MKCMTSAIAGLKAHQTGIDVVGNNISNINTYGFKSSSTTFRDTMYQTITSPSKGNTKTGSAGMNPTQIGFGAAASSVSVNTTNGGQDSTGNSMDCYIDGNGYFIVADGPLTPNDATNPTYYTPSSYKYTRVGSLQFKDGFLTDGNGNYICGQQNTAFKASPADTTQIDPSPATPWTPDTDYTADASPYTAISPQAIHYNVATGTTGDKLDNIKISSDGTITATNASNQTVTIGQIGIATFPNAAGLEQAGGSYYTSNDGSGAAAYATPGTNSSGDLKTGSLEASNVDLATELSNMIVYERGYQANTKIITAADEMMQTLVNMK